MSHLLFNMFNADKINIISFRSDVVIEIFTIAQIKA